MAIKFRKQTAVTVEVPTSVYVQLFVDSDGLPKIKDSTGTITTLSAAGDGSANALQTTGAHVNVSTAAPPTIGQVLTATNATTAIWQDPVGGGPADALSTSGADVNVSAASPPTTGQVLTATSATTATWQAPTGGVATSGGVVSGNLAKYFDGSGNLISDAGFAPSDVRRISTMGSGVDTFLTTPSSANLAAAVTGETGTGALVFATSPTLVTPNLGTPASATLTNATGLPISTGVAGLGAGVAAFLATPSSANLATAVTDETGSGALVLATNPVLVTPNLGTPSAATLTNATGLPVSTGIAGLGAGVATFLATPSSANLATALTDETGTGANVFATSPTLVTPLLGTPTSGVLSNCTGRVNANQTADQIATSGTAVTISSTAPSTGQVLTATSATAANWQTPGGASDPWFFFHQAPASPHADSDEFTSGALNARWTVVANSALTTPVVPIGAVSEVGAATTPRITPNYRGSFFAYQGQDGGIIRQFAMPAVLQVRFRLDVPISYNSGASFMNLYVGAAGGGTPDITNNYFRWGWTNSGGPITTAGTNTLGLLPAGRSSGGSTDGTFTNMADMIGKTRNLELIMLFTQSGGSARCKFYIRQGPGLDYVHESGAAGMATGANCHMYLRLSHQWNNKGGTDPNAIGLCDYIRIRLDDMLEDYV